MSADQPEPSSLRRYVLLTVKLSVSIILLVVLFSRIDVAQLWATARLASVPWLLMALAIFAFNVVVAAWRWHLLLGAQDVPAPMASLLASYLTANFFNN